MNRRSRRLLLPMLTLGLAIGLGACDRKATRIDPSTSNQVPTNTATQSAPPAARPSEDVSDPAKGPGVEVTEQKGTETGMVGGASGTVASGGKPGSGTSAGGGTGAAESSSERIEKK